MSGPSHEKRWQPDAQTVVITVPFDPWLLRTNRKMSREKRARLTAKARMDAWLCWVAAGKPHINGCVSVAIEVRRKGRRLDQESLTSGLKATIDGLFNNAITQTDHPRWCQFGIPREVKWDGPPEVVFTVTGDGRGPYSREAE